METHNMVEEQPENKTESYTNIKKEFTQAVLDGLSEVNSEISDRNEEISERDELIYGEGLAAKLDIPMGHDLTAVNWLKRAVEIHRDQFMGRGFQVISTYDSQDPTYTADAPEESDRALLENKKAKDYAEQRRALIDAIIKDNGGIVMFQELAESAGVAGTACIKTYYDEDEEKFVISPIESVENVYAIWSDSNFRKTDAVGYVYQITKRDAIEEYGVSEDTPTSPVGEPLTFNYGNSPTKSTQEMVTVMEVTGYIKEWGSNKGKIKKVKLGQENEMNVLIVGDELVRIIDEEKKMPKYYILPNKRVRRRAWGVSDISDAAIDINLTYIETLSDWRTVSSKVNFPKIKAYNFTMDSELPKPKPRTSELLPLADGQDLQLLNQGDANQFDFKAQLEELKEQFVRETAISRIFFNDPSVDLNSNQALMTSLKPTTDVAEAKKSIWTPILTKMFEDALATIALYDTTAKEIVDESTSWNLKVVWPSILQKEDPVYQQNLINRWNANTISLQSYIEAQGETKEEIDRIKDEMRDIITASILGKQLGTLVQMSLQPQGMNGSVPQGGTNPNGNQDMRQQTATTAENGPGMGPVSQPGSGATPVSPEGAIAQTNQNLGA